MGKALAQRLSETHQLYFYDRCVEKAEILEREGYGKASQDIKQALHRSEMVILAVKPQNFKEVVALIEQELKKEQVIVSLLTGISIGTLKQFLPGVTIIRMMPNLAIICGEGVIGLCSEEILLEAEKKNLTHLFASLGTIYWLAENQINALTALTGSGPAFFFVMLEAMIDAGIAMGFSAIDAQKLVCQMIQGSLRLTENMTKHPGELKWQITSPQGTTIAGLKTLEEFALRGGIINTFLSAYDRANQLSQEEGSIHKYK